MSPSYPGALDSDQSFTYPTQDARLMRQQQHPRSNSTGAIKREDVAAAAEQEQLRGPRSKSAEVRSLRVTSHLNRSGSLSSIWACIDLYIDLEGRY